MDKEKLENIIKNNPQLREQLKLPKIQQFLHQILEDELMFESLKARFTSSSSSSNNVRKSHQRHNKNHQQSGGFQNPNDYPLSPLEIKLIEGNDSDEQQFLRLLLDSIQQS